MTVENESVKEQIRGLYMVGLLAVLVTFKVSSKLDPIADGFFSVVIMLWGAYSFFMVFAYSTILRPFFTLPTSTNEKIASFLKDMAHVILWMSLVVSIAFYIWYYWVLLYLIALVLGIGALIYFPVRAVRKRLKKEQK